MARIRLIAIGLEPMRSYWAITKSEKVIVCAKARWLDTSRRGSLLAYR